MDGGCIYDAMHDRAHEEALTGATEVREEDSRIRVGVFHPKLGLLTRRVVRCSRTFHSDSHAGSARFVDVVTGVVKPGGRGLNAKAPSSLSSDIAVGVRLLRACVRSRQSPHNPCHDSCSCSCEERCFASFARNPQRWSFISSEPKTITNEGGVRLLPDQLSLFDFAYNLLELGQGYWGTVMRSQPQHQVPRAAPLCAAPGHSKAVATSSRAS